MRAITTTPSAGALAKMEGNADGKSERDSYEDDYDGVARIMEIRPATTT